MENELTLPLFKVKTVKKSNRGAAGFALCVELTFMPQHIDMCRPVCPKWEYIVSLLSRILNASDGEEKVFWLVERILWCARCTSETRTRVPLHSTPLLVHSSTSSTCTSCSPPTGRRSPPRSRENSENNSDLLPFVIWTLVCLSPSDRSSVTLRDSREP